MWNDSFMDYEEKNDEFFYGYDCDLHMGVELEVDLKGAEEDCEVYGLMEDLAEVSELHICKPDGSLGPDGVEIVSPPCTLEWHLSNKMNWEDITSVCLDHGYKSDQTRTCGLHVHVDREWFNDSARVGVWLTGLFFKFNQELTKFARRSERAIANWAKFTRVNLDDLDGFTDYDDFETDLRDDRYRAINLCNDYTIEFRLWKGTLNLETLRATLQMTQLLCEIVNYESLSTVQNLTWEDICERAEQYEDLTKYLIRRGLKEESKCA